VGGVHNGIVPAPARVERALFVQTAIILGMAAGSDRVKPSKTEVQVAVESCDVCSGPTYERNCKVICRRCGYTRDCSDP
jgi:hypothetical protein